MSSGLHPALDPWLELGQLLIGAGAAKARHALGDLRRRPRRGNAYRSRRPGVDTPLWNMCAARLRHELKPYGAKARFARFLGIPRQRVNDFLKRCSRLPDAELTLQMMSWLAQKHHGGDPSL